MSKGTINIGGDANDTAYRYKMSPLILKVEGRGNGIKTVLMNVVEVSKQLHTDASWLTKFFGIELGALSKFDKKRDVGIVNGVKKSKEIQAALNIYIKHFVLCPNCGLPELQQKIHSKKNLLMIRCLSCGYKGHNKSTHRVKQYMINNPPTKVLGGTVKSKKDKRKQKQKKQGTSEKKDSKENNTNNEIIDIENDNKWSVEVNDEAVAKRKQEEMSQLNKNTSRSKTNSPNKTLSRLDDNGPIGILRSYLNDQDLHKKSWVYDTFMEIKRLSIAHNLEGIEKMKTIFNAILDTSKLDKFINSFKKYKSLLLFLFEKNSKDVDYFWACFEDIIINKGIVELFPNVYKILYSLYDSEILTDDQIIAWYNSPNDEAIIVEKNDCEEIKKKAKVFVEWLQQEEDDDEEDDDEEDEE